MKRKAQPQRTQRSTETINEENKNKVKEQLTRDFPLRAFVPLWLSLTTRPNKKMGSFFSSPNRSDRGDTAEVGSKLLLLSCPAAAILEIPGITSTPCLHRAIYEAFQLAWKNAGRRSPAVACATSPVEPGHLSY